jgi:hypothetical protein
MDLQEEPYRNKVITSECCYVVILDRGMQPGEGGNKIYFLKGILLC